MKQALAKHLSNEDYHAEDSLSYSQLKVFSRSPQEFFQRFVARSWPAPQPSPEMVIGSALHCWVLEPEEFVRRFTVAPKVDGRTKAGKAIRAAYKETNGRDVLPLDDYELVQRMAAAVLENPVASHLFQAEGLTEPSIFWTRRGHNLRCRPDRALDAHILVDLKTTADPSPAAFRRTCARYAYQIQAAHYLDGWRALTGADDPHFVFVVVGKNPPHDVFSYELSQIDLELSLDKRDAILADIRRCEDSGVWRHPAFDQVQVLDLPRYAHDDV